MKHPETARRISLALSNKNMKPQELADRSGVNKSSISQYVNGSHVPSNISSGKMASILEVNPLWLMGFDVPMEPVVKSDKGVRIPVLGRVAAGVPIDAIEDVIGYEEIPESLARTGEYFALVIKGDSMSPGICDKDTVIVRKQSDADSNEIVIAAVNGDEAVCKRLRKYEGGIELISSNPSYEPMQFTSDDIDKTPVTILGKVIELRRRMG